MGTFADRDTEIYQARGADGPAPDQLLLSSDASFAADESLPEMFARTSGGTTADLDGDGDFDLVVSRNWDDDQPSAPGSQILRNDGGSLVPAGSGLPTQFAGRSVAVLDYDLDGLLDLFITADEGGSVLLRNEGDLAFTDVTAAAGLSQGIVGLGVAVGDLTGDRRQDIFVAGSNQLFIAEGESFRQADSSVFAWPPIGDEDLVTGASIADVNRDGLLDIAVGHHFNSTIDDGAQVPVRLFLNRGDAQFEDVTEAAGLVGLPTKGPHVELNDMDNDGWPDLVTTASAADGTRPAVFRHTGLDGDIPTVQRTGGSGEPSVLGCRAHRRYRPGRATRRLSGGVRPGPALTDVAQRDRVGPLAGSFHGRRIGIRPRVAGRGLRGRALRGMGPLCSGLVRSQPLRATPREWHPWRISGSATTSKSTSASTPQATGRWWSSRAWPVTNM